jgi:hypothetical protein
MGIFAALRRFWRHDPGGPEALRTAAALQFDLFDESGHLVPTDFVNLFELPENPTVWVIARIRHSYAGRGATIAPTSSSDRHRK